MIFVIIGICVLVASFLIALVSLVREQGKLSKMAAQGEAEQTLANSLKAKKTAALEKGNKSIPSGVLNKQAADIAHPSIADPAAGQVTTDTAKPAINRPLFPWEEGKYQGASDMTEADRKKVEMLRAQLAELKSRVVSGGANEEEIKVPVVKPKIEEGQQRLSGEISIADLKRQ